MLEIGKLYLGMLLMTTYMDYYASYDERRGYIAAVKVNPDITYRVVDFRGQYVKLERLGYYRPVTYWRNIKDFRRVPDEYMADAMRRVAEHEKTLAANRIQAAEELAASQTAALSQNTVTKALVHAADNGYCNETVVALVSAGHSMPKGTFRFDMNVSVMIDVDGKDRSGYYLMRQLFGETRGDLSAIPEKDIYRYDEWISELLGKWAGNGTTINWDKGVTFKGANIQFPRPVIRPLAEVTAAQPAYRDEED